MAALYAREPSASRSGQMQSKTLERVEVKSADRGEVSAVFSTFNVVDKDNDVTLPGAFTEGAEVIISAYEHKSWGGALPVGKGRIRTTRTEAILDGQFFMDTTAGRDTFAVVKQLGGRQQWSYGYEALDSEPGRFDGKDVRFLKRLEVPEVSPVLVGAGLTRTVGVKAAEQARQHIEQERTVSEYKAAVRPHETPISTKAWDRRAAEGLLQVAPTIAELRSLYAWCDPDGDPETKSSYRYPHHDAPGGPANLRACLVEVARLNGAGSGSGIAEGDRRGVFNHLAAHLQDGDRDAPELKAAPTGTLKFHEEAAAVLAGLDDLLVRTAEVMALRRTKGKALAATSVDLLEWVYDGMRDLRRLLDSPQEDAAREYARFVASQLRLGETA
jgi:hypothetical protein